MNSESKKFFEPRPNYSALAELEEKHRSTHSEDDIRSFLDFWQEVYDAWKENYSPYDLNNLAHKIQMRKKIIDIFGIRP